MNDNDDRSISGNGEAISLSVDETNKLRASLGLAPLETEATENRKRKRETIAPAEHVEKKPTAAEIRDRLDRVRTQRRIAEMMRLPEEEEEDDDLDVVAWTAKMRQRDKSETKPESENRGMKRHRESSSAVPLTMQVGHGLKLREGEEVVLTLADQHVLDEHGDESLGSGLVLENTRLKELERYKKNVRERKRVQEFMASAGPTGISGRALDMEDSSESEDDAKPSGAPMAPDESKALRSAEEEPETEVAAEMPPKSTVTTVVVLPPDSEPVKEESMKDAKFKKPQKKEKLMKKRKAINWADVFGDEDESETATESLGPVVERREWGVVGGDIHEEEEAENAQLYGAIFNSMREMPVEDVRVKEEETLKAIECLPQVKQEPEEVKLDLQNNLGLIDDGVSTTKPEMVITATAEFAKSLQTPLEKLEEKKTSGRRGAEFLSRRRQRGDGDATKVTEFQDLPDEILEEKAAVFDEERIDGGLASALHYIKKRGDLSEDKWKVGRVGKVQKLPLHKSTEAEDVKIDYTDNYGNVMNPKQAFRYMSWSFHGKGPGKAKTEKMLKKMELEHKMKTSDPLQVLPTMRALRAQQSKGQAYLVLSGGTDGHA